MNISIFSFERFIICDSLPEDYLDKRPYRTFNSTIEQLMHLIRKVYREIQENVTGSHPTIYRQVRAGAEVAVIASPKNIGFKEDMYQKLNEIPVISHVLLYPPMIINPPSNKRRGQFIRVKENFFSQLEIKKSDWLCYPAKVGPLVMMVYVHKEFCELGLSLSNLFELATEEDLKRQPDAIYFFGVDPETLKNKAEFPTIFYEDEEQGMLVAACPREKEFGYFGYLKKMLLTLHNIKMMRLGRMPFHGALVNIILKGGKSATVLLIGDTGAGKSESLEAFREYGQEIIRDMVIIADDMGSLEIASNGDILGYGTEIGAFLRLDDLQPGYAFGQLDRAIIMNPNKINARIILPVTNFSTLIKGYKIDYILYANNYEGIDEEHPIIDRFKDVNQAINVFREGAVMSKGTTTSTGLVHSYFANIFGPVQYKELHDKIAQKFFKAFFDQGIYVGQIRTRLGIPGSEMEGPKQAAQSLLNLLKK